MIQNLIIICLVLVTQLSMAALTKDEFINILKDSEDLTRPLFTEKGFDFETIADWQEDSINAHAENWNQLKKVVVYGGVARWKSLNADGLRALFCHEVGHHLGGYPYRQRLDVSWASSEGQADYWASTSCLKILFEKLDNKKYLKNKKIPQVVIDKCKQSFNTKKDQDICIRSALAGYNIMQTFNEAYNKGDRYRFIEFEKPDRSIMPWSWPKHNNVQCRTDTYFQGALCVEDGNCRYDMNLILGLRPRCWFFPGDEESFPNFIHKYRYTGPSKVH